MNPTAKAYLKRNLGRIGLTGRDVRAIRTWTQIRGQAVAGRRSILLGAAIEWTDRGRVELVPVEVPLAGPGEVTISVDCSAISVGTEKAQFLELPNAKVEYPFRPGYSGAGKVLAVGEGVAHVKVGDLVAASRVNHQSVQTIDSMFVHRVASGVAPADASLVELAVIAAHGLERGNLVSKGTDGSKSDYVIIGAGTIGTLAERIAAARGHGPGTFIASSRAKEFVAREGQLFLTIDDHDALATLRADVVIESTSDPRSLRNVIAQVRPGGTIVMLGSPRGTEMTIPVDELRNSGARVVGAHISLLHDDARRELGQEFVDRLSDGSLTVDDLITDRVDPADAPRFYRDRISNSGLIAAVFDWTTLPNDVRHAARRLTARPDIRAGGIEYGDSPARRGALGWSSHRTLDESEDQRTRGSMRFGIVGCGEIALQNAGAIAAATNATMTKAFDSDPALAADLVDSFGGATTGSLDELLDHSDVDAVLLCVPHHLHEPMAIQAFEAGKHVLLEKPLANSTASGQAIVAAENVAAGRGSVCFPHRFDLRVQAARDLISRGAIGEVTGFSVTFYQDKPPSYWVGGYSGRSISGWRTSPDEAGGGVLIMNACHYLDLLLDLTKLDIKGVTAATSFEGGREVEDAAFITLNATNGACGSVSVSSSVRGARYDEFRIWGTDGHIEVFPTPRAYTLRPVGGLTASRWQELGASTPGPYRTTYFEHFISSLADGDEPAVTMSDGLAVQRLIDAAYRSAQSGYRIDPRSDVTQPNALPDTSTS